MPVIKKLPHFFFPHIFFLPHIFLFSTFFSFPYSFFSQYIFFNIKDVTKKCEKTIKNFKILLVFNSTSTLYSSQKASTSFSQVEIANSNDFNNKTNITNIEIQKNLIFATKKP